MTNYRQQEIARSLNAADTAPNANALYATNIQLRCRGNKSSLSDFDFQSDRETTGCAG